MEMSTRAQRCCEQAQTAVVVACAHHSQDIEETHSIYQYCLLGSKLHSNASSTHYAWLERLIIAWRVIATYSSGGSFRAGFT